MEVFISDFDKKFKTEVNEIVTSYDEKQQNFLSMHGEGTLSRFIYYIYFFNQKRKLNSLLDGYQKVYTSLKTINLISFREDKLDTATFHKARFQDKATYNKSIIKIHNYGISSDEIKLFRTICYRIYKREVDRSMEKESLDKNQTH